MVPLPKWSNWPNMACLSTIKRGLKGSTPQCSIMANLPVILVMTHLGPFQVHLDHFLPFQVKIDVLPQKRQVLLGQSAFDFTNICQPKIGKPLLEKFSVQTGIAKTALTPPTVYHNEGLGYSSPILGSAQNFLFNLQTEFYTI